MYSEVDELKLYFGFDYQINEHITIRNPKVRDIVEFGEAEYFSLVSLLAATPSDFISPLADCGIDWEKLTDYEFFHSLISKWVSPESTKILLGDLNLQKMVLMKNKYDEIVMVGDNGLLIDANIYRIIADTIRKIHSLERNVRKAGNAFTKELMIEVDRDDRRRAAEKPFKSMLRNTVSAMINMPGFKYGLNEILDMPYMAFMDSVNRMLAIKRADTLSMGSVCGMADLSKIPKKDFNWLRDLAE